MRSLHLNSLYQARLFIDVYISGTDGSKYPFDCIVDTGCVNTLVDEKILEVADHIDLGFTQPIKIAGMSTISKATVLKQVDFGGLLIDKMLVFVAPLTGTPVLNRMLLGLNTLNNWNYKVKRADNVIEFSESLILPVGANSKNKYTNYFDKYGNYVLVEE
ncbi:MAG: hypothetical protein LBD23_13640 [Oscillospiraceae bacterium]|jgi:hypothetical protein|nr:hypothetical protein [Oscillospiraceae bacterium]